MIGVGRVYVAEFNAVAVTVQQDFFEVLCPADAILAILEYGLSQYTDVGDAAEEILSILEKRGEGAVTSGTGGTVPTARPYSKGDTAFGGTVEANNTTKLAVGTGAIIRFPSMAWNIRQEKEKVITPEQNRIISPGDRWALELATTPVDSITMNGYVVFAEIGG